MQPAFHTIFRYAHGAHQRPYQNLELKIFRQQKMVMVNIRGKKQQIM